MTTSIERIIETTAGQVTAELRRLGVSDHQHVTIMVDADDWLQKAREASRPLVIATGLSDDAIDRMIKQAQREVADQIEG
jgi:hypothetical protein